MEVLRICHLMKKTFGDFILVDLNTGCSKQAKIFFHVMYSIVTYFCSNKKHAKIFLPLSQQKLRLAWLIKYQ